jgi:sugar lactone lactonase YvrE
MDVDCIANGRDVLGEGPCWVAPEARLYWFDIKQARLSWIEPASGRRGGWTLDVRASAATACAFGGLIAATEAGLAHIDTATGALRMVQPVELGPGFRSNDGKIDPAGRFWWSRMDDGGGERPGSVYRTDPDGSTRRVLEGIHIPNTLACSPDARTLYVADSKQGVLNAHAVGPDGALGEARPFADACGGEATPDGSAVDAEGYLWNAQWGGWRIVRYAPDGGVDRILQMPVCQPTSCAFGGPDLDVLFITSAREGLSEDALAAQPLAGGLFACRPGVRGLPLPAFEGFPATSLPDPRRLS